MTDAPEPPRLPGWNHVPRVPIRVSPFFSWPPDPRRMAAWVGTRWLTLAENTVVLAITVLCWALLQPAPEQAMGPGWILALWLRNLALMTAVAGGLHWYFYVRRGQDALLKYDPRDLMVKGRQFTFGGQIRDNMFWTLGSGVAVWTAFEAGMYWALAQGWAPEWRGGPVLFVLWLVLTPVWISFHFYWVHRLLHWGPFYDRWHALHHRNINVGPWSGLSMHPGEHVLLFSSILIHLIVPAHPFHILFHMLLQSLQAASSHTGYESLLVRDRKRLDLGTFHHQMHHRYFEVNYGNLEVPWDKWFGTFHDGTVESHERLKGRRRLR